MLCSLWSIIWGSCLLSPHCLRVTSQESQKSPELKSLPAKGHACAPWDVPCWTSLQEGHGIPGRPPLDSQTMAPTEVESWDLEIPSNHTWLINFAGHLVCFAFVLCCSSANQINISIKRWEMMIPGLHWHGHIKSEMWAVSPEQCLYHANCVRMLSVVSSLSSPASVCLTSSWAGGLLCLFVLAF